MGQQMMTPIEWLIALCLGIRALVVRRRRGGWIAEAIADAPLILPCMLLQEARVFAQHRWSIWLPGGVPLLAVVSAVALLGGGVTLSARLATMLRRRFRWGRQPWATAAVDFLVIAGLTTGFETVLFHAGAWTYRFGGALGSVPVVGIPWAAAIGAGGFGLFCAASLRQFRRWASDEVRRLAVRTRVAAGLAPPLAVAAPPRGAGAWVGVWRALGGIVLRLLDL
jgi:hypothetical protein